MFTVKTRVFLQKFPYNSVCYLVLLRVRFILTVKTQGVLLPGSANGLPEVSRALYPTPPGHL